MAQIEITTDAAKIVRKFDRLPSDMQTSVVTSLKRELLLTESFVIRNTRVKFRRGAGGLQGRLTSFVRKQAKLGFDAAIGFRRTRGFPYELSQEFGAKARPGRAMAIPLTSTARRAEGPRQFPRPLSFVKIRGRAFLMGRAGQGGARRFHYILVKRIEPRLDFTKSVTARFPQISEAIEDGARRGAARATGGA